MGSSLGSEVFTNFPEPVRRTDVFVGFAEVAWDAAGAGSGADDGQNMLVVVMAAITPSTASAITSFRFSTPSFT